MSTGVTCHIFAWITDEMAVLCSQLMTQLMTHLQCWKDSMDDGVFTVFE